MKRCIAVASIALGCGLLLADSVDRSRIFAVRTPQIGGREPGVFVWNLSDRELRLAVPRPGCSSAPDEVRVGQMRPGWVPGSHGIGGRLGDALYHREFGP
jgi:hypothetical protein